MSTILLERATVEVKQNTERIENRINEVMNLVSDVSNGLYLDEDLQVLMKTTFTNRLTIINALNNFRQIDDYLHLYNEISSIRIYVENDSLLDSSQIIKLRDEHYETDWYKEAVNRQGKMTIMVRYDTFARQEYLSVIRAIKNNSGHIQGVMVINISNDHVDSIFASEPYDYLLILDQEQLVTSSFLGQERGNIDQLTFDTFNALDEGSASIVYDKVQYEVFVDIFSDGSTDNQIKLVTPIPKELLNKEMTASLQMSIWIIAISIILSVVVLYSLSNVFSSRVNRFREEMHKVSEGDFSVVSSIAGDDEIGDLSKDLNIMTQGIQKIIHEAYEVQLQKEQLAGKQKEAQFKMLASQINPHFLYNSLETIRMKAHINQQTEIAKVVKKLASIMRRNLSIDNNEVPLENDIELIRHYLEIQQFRFGDKVSFDFTVGCEMSDIKILPLLLQPVVENAFVHGLEPKIGQGHIDVDIQINDSKLCVCISDDGVGIDQKKLDKINYKLSQNADNINGSIGLTNVYQRLKLYYGDASEMYIESEEGIGTRVTLKIPLILEDVENV